MSELTEYLQRGSPAGTVLNYVEVSRSPPKVAIVADPSNFQATACALVLCKLLGQACWHDVAMSPGVVPRGEAPLAGATACVMVFSKGAVGQFDFTMAMYQAALHQLPILPIMSEEDFHVLSEQEVTEAVSLVLPALNTAGCVADSKALFSIVSQIFVEIAIRFAPQDGAFSADVLEAKATEVVQRLRGGVQTTKLEVSSELLAKAAAESARRIPL
uniref:Uncharacterized protein n=1 Tax=Zooxanthella nutricula TaxID=1333877 RepID=A0A7S2K509_9DINO